MSNGEFYEGNIKNNQRHGQGSHHYKTGDEYIGEWQNDRRIGRGRLLTKDGSKLAGMFIEDAADGFVEYEDRMGNIFQSENEEAKAAKDKSKEKRLEHKFIPGSFRDGKLINLGICNFKNGDKYRGNFKDGRFCGFGTLKYQYSLPGSNGSDFEEATYEGMFKAGKREGEGTMTWVDGSSFTGIWKNNMRHYGEMKFVNQSIYIGSF